MYWIAPVSGSETGRKRRKIENAPHAFCSTSNSTVRFNLPLLLAPTFAAALWNKGGWIQNRANTLALWCMFAQVFPLFEDASRFTTVTSVYGEGGIAAAMGSTMPVTANPTAQGLISVIAFAVNVFSFAYILKQAKVQKKNPWKEEIFVDTKDYQEAMARTRQGFGTVTGACSGRKNSAPGTPLIEDIEETDYEPDCFRYTSQEYT